MSQFMSSKYFDVLEALLDNDPEISWSAYKDRMAELGCDTLLYVYVDTITPEADENAFIYKSTVSDGWFEHYFKEDHHLLDHVFQRRTISGIETPLWLGSEVKQPEGFENKHFSEHSSQAGQAGFRACINYKMSNNARRADSDIFAMTIGTTGTTDDLKNSLASNGREIRLLTNLMHTIISLVPPLRVSRRGKKNA